MSEVSSFRQGLTDLINRESKEKGSGTPDFILAEYLSDCLDAFDKAQSSRAGWYGERPEITFVIDEDGKASEAEEPTAP
jgi:hypothetical protein